MFYNDRLEISKEVWTEILTDREVSTQPDLNILKLVYESENHEIRASEIASRLNIPHHGQVNLQISRFSKRIIPKTGVKPPIRGDGKPRWWHVPFLGYEKAGRFPWIMRPELVIAFEEVFGQSDTEFVYSVEINIENTPSLYEGTVKQVFVNRYERNRHARSICIAHYGSRCIVCGFDFEKIYGAIGKDKIHIHHLIPLSQIRKEYELDPILDLRPVCPNCHLIIHSKREPFTIEEIRKMLAISANDELLFT